MSNLIAKEYQGFEQIKHTDESNNEIGSPANWRLYWNMQSGVIFQR